MIVVKIDSEDAWHALTVLPLQQQGQEHAPREQTSPFSGAGGSVEQRHVGANAANKGDPHGIRDDGMRKGGREEELEVSRSRDGNAEQVGHTQSTVGQDDAQGNSNAQSEKVPTAAKAVEFDIHRFRHALLEDFHEDLHAKHVHLAREPTPRLASEGGLPGTPGKFEAAVESAIAKQRTTNLERRVGVILSRNGQATPRRSQAPVVLSRAPEGPAQTLPISPIEARRWSPTQMLMLNASPRSLATSSTTTTTTRARADKTAHSYSRSPADGRGAEQGRHGHRKSDSPVASNLGGLRASADALARMARSMGPSGMDHEPGPANADLHDRARAAGSVTVAAHIGHSHTGNLHQQNTSLFENLRRSRSPGEVVSANPNLSMGSPAPHGFAPLRRP
jgi:hypothetical protein